LAVVGDNRTQGEIIAPENKIVENVLKALEMFRNENGNTSNNNGSQNIVLNFEGNLSQLARILKPQLDSEAKRKGTKLIVGGAY
jgi:hypothetical protein